tara:strand:+ start:427 stop:849 length:423 start_codon:yes stop_codon:yes gene_type:complete
MKKICIVRATYYKNISDDMLSGAIAKLKKNKINSKFVKVVDVPGVFEIPIIVAKNINSFDGFIALGCVIKGKTPHFKFISNSTTQALMNLSIKYKKPIGYGIITCLNKKQAIDRSKPNKKNKGGEATNAVLSVLSILKND